MERIKYSTPEKQQKYLRVKKRMGELRKFYKHVAIYILVNIFISGFKIREYMKDEYTFEEAFQKLDVYFVWIVWGVFVILQGIRTYNSKMILGSEWEERKIREYMNENKR